MALRYARLLSPIILLISLWSFSGCGATQQQLTVSSSTLTREILGLHQGMHVEEVKKRIGQPISESSDGSNVELSYGLWQLSFVDGRLASRSMVFIPKQKRTSIVGGERREAIERLHLGMVSGRVKAILGPPEVVYVIYEEDGPPVKVFRYEPWELTFVDGILTQRAQ